MNPPRHTVRTQATAMQGNLSIREEGRGALITRYAVNFYDDVIRVYVTDRPEMVTMWFEILEARGGLNIDRLIVGLEVIWCCNANNPVTILQLCVGNCCLIFQIFLANAEIPQKLREFLADERYTFVGVDILHDVEMLFRDHRLRVRGRILDLGMWSGRQYVGFWTYLTRSDSRPLWNMLGTWDWRQLDPELIMYACLDPIGSCWIGHLLLNA